MKMVSEESFTSLIDLQSIKILSMAMKMPVTVQEVSEELDIPPATCYRKFNELVEKGLLVELEKILVQKQKRRASYVSMVKEIKIEVTSDGLNLKWKYREKPVEMWETIKGIK
jgi:predicted transcriptional regulator